MVGVAVKLLALLMCMDVQLLAVSHFTSSGKAILGRRLDRSLRGIKALIAMSELQIPLQ
jgi:hypothetical protein